MTPFLEYCKCQDIPAALEKIASLVIFKDDLAVRQLDSSVSLSNSNLDFVHDKSVGDIRHATSNRGNAQSLVDQRKLRNAERKIEAKRKARIFNGEPIPEWNPLHKPAIVVNQMKSSNIDSRVKDIKLENFDIQYAGKKILTNAHLSLSYGRRYGLVGKNGIGKSTLLRAIAHKELIIPSHIKILHVEQEIEGDDTPALKSVLEADEERTRLLLREKEINDKLAKTTLTVTDADMLEQELRLVYQRMEEIEADKAESKASAILSGLGFSPMQQVAATKTFSGGWRMVRLV